MGGFEPGGARDGIGRGDCDRGGFGVFRGLTWEVVLFMSTRGVEYLCVGDKVTERGCKALSVVVKKTCLVPRGSP
jgi:hypothetical protein